MLKYLGLATNNEKFKNGDKVRVINSELVGIIQGKDYYGTRYSLVSNDTDCNTFVTYWNEDELTAIEDNEDSENSEDSEDNEDKNNNEVLELTIKVPVFSVDSMSNKSFMAVVIGQKESGKTQLIKNLMNKLHLKDGLVMCPTNKYSHYELTDKLRVVEHSDVDILRQFIDEGMQHDQKSINKIVVLDDIDESIYKDISTMNSLINGRYWNCSMITTSQYGTELRPNMRTNINYVFITKIPRIMMRRVYEYYAIDAFHNFEIFCAVLDECSKNYGFLVINNKNFFRISFNENCNLF